MPTGLTTLITVNNVSYTSITVTIPTKIVIVKEDGLPTTNFVYQRNVIAGGQDMTSIMGDRVIFSNPGNFWRPGDVVGKLKISSVGSVNFQQIEEGTT